VLLTVAAGCSDSNSGDSPSTTSPSSGPSTSTGTPAASAAGAPLRVDLIDDAVAAVEAELGGRQDYFEINATPGLVNLFVARDAGGVTAFAYVAGVLTSEDLTGAAEGTTFRADALNFDPARVTDAVSAELPTSRQDAFEILGGPNGAVIYSVIVTSSAGGQLIVEVGPDGTIAAVDPV
jgi:hypothetical protein